MAALLLWFGSTPLVSYCLQTQLKCSCLNFFSPALLTPAFGYSCTHLLRVPSKMCNQLIPNLWKFTTFSTEHPVSGNLLSLGQLGQFIILAKTCYIFPHLPLCYFIKKLTYCKAELKHRLKYPYLN